MAVRSDLADDHGQLEPRIKLGEARSIPIAMTSAVRHRPLRGRLPLVVLWLGLIGALVVVYGSGLLTARVVVRTTVGDITKTQRVLDMSWQLLVIGSACLAVAAALAEDRRIFRFVPYVVLACLLARVFMVTTLGEVID